MQQPPREAEELFGSALSHVERYAELLSSVGVDRGLIGPREVPRLWERHLMNCGVVTELVPERAELVDVGSGAGLPGVVLGIMRPDIVVTLIEPLLRRSVFLRECREELQLDNVTVVRGRAEELAGQYSVDVVTARAVAPLPRLAGWALPLLRPGGQLLALKGAQAEAELESARNDLLGQRASSAEVIRVGNGKVDPATTVVRVTADSRVGESRTSTGRRGSGGGRKRGRKR
ncbi:16S rRNA (guanine(527)-N(7))-methyltransferase RsmG [Lipingzhangella sp. LS1_29]|uniref:Ribosomal RNA small subunit methyltransferase G n=1 Tax=Lipingzhangella rawalii TaxID=2055835 RepID=A0ABU2H839_9ACTN|nr:16S rRNA (guanine(527)-N(7))-methyltransferase RsmG [Lipingzhangella rawalii]MDS1271469.1 16S rRNA (guanine(527)-N(7))-methyltransferase RsmG [Lipingzhangella rawalii]